jgi:hypothetical protein
MEARNLGRSALRVSAEGERFHAYSEALVEV